MSCDNPGRNHVRSRVTKSKFIRGMNRWIPTISLEYCKHEGQKVLLFETSVSFEAAWSQYFRSQKRIPPNSFQNPRWMIHVAWPRLSKSGLFLGRTYFTVSDLGSIPRVESFLFVINTGFTLCWWCNNVTVTPSQQSLRDWRNQDEMRDASHVLWSPYLINKFISDGS